MAGEFEGRTAIVTGAARGLGFSISRLLVDRGARVIMADIDASAVAASASSLQGTEHATFPVAVDLGDEEEVQSLVAAVESFAGGRLDLLVNNVGGWRHARFHEISMTDWEWTLRTNLTAPFLTTRAVMGIMVEQGYGRIVNVASTDAHRAKPSLPHYAAAKSALVSLTRSLAEELAPHQVLVNAVSPGAIATDTARQQDWFAERIKSIPVGRAAEPEDIAEAILFLGSDRNRFVVGQTLMVNGGLYMS